MCAEEIRKTLADACWLDHCERAAMSGDRTRNVRVSSTLKVCRLVWRSGQGQAIRSVGYSWYCPDVNLIGTRNIHFPDKVHAADCKTHQDCKEKDRFL